MKHRIHMLKLSEISIEGFRGGNDITLEFWVNAEQFYEFWMVILGIFLFTLLIGIIFVSSYIKKKNNAKVNILLLILTIGTVLVGFFGHFRYKPYLEQATYITPQLRDRQPRMLTYVPYLRSDQNAYVNMNSLERLRNVVLYEEEQVSEPVSYLGKDEHFHYFERSNGELFKQNQKVFFSKEIEEAELNGSLFTLKNKEFLEIGFKEPEQTMFDHIQIPMNQEGITYKPEKDSRIPTGIPWWNF